MIWKLVTSLERTEKLNPLTDKTYQIVISPDATFNDIINILNSMEIRYTDEPNGERHKALEKHSKEIIEE